VGTGLTAYHAWAKKLIPLYEQLAAEAPKRDNPEAPRRNRDDPQGLRHRGQFVQVAEVRTGQPRNVPQRHEGTRGGDNGLRGVRVARPLDAAFRSTGIESGSSASGGTSACCRPVEVGQTRTALQMRHTEPTLDVSTSRSNASLLSGQSRDLLLLPLFPRGETCPAALYRLLQPW